MNIENFDKRELKFLEFVKEKHKNHFRKHTNEPYVNHLINVANIVKPFQSKYPYITLVALGHDLLEDTDCTEKELHKTLKSIGLDFLTRVCVIGYIKDLTYVFIKENFPCLNRKYRKQLEALRLSEISHTAQTVKYADLIDNTKNIRKNDEKFSKTYIKEKEFLLKLMVNGETKLYGEAIKLIS